MDINDINNKISVAQMELNLEKDPIKKKKLSNDLSILNFRKDIEVIKQQINKLTKQK